MPHDLKDGPPRLLVTIPQAARSLSISRAMLYSLVAKGEGPPVVHLGRSVRVPVADLRKWVEELTRTQLESDQMPARLI